MLTPSLVFAYWMRGSAMPAHLMQPDRLLEALQTGLTLIVEREALASRKLFYDIGHEYLPRLSFVTDPRRQLDSRSKQVLILGHRLAGVQPDADTDVGVRVGLIVLG